MTWLELRIPPVVLVAITALLMWSISGRLPGLDVSDSIRIGLVVLFVIFGVSTVIAGILAFRKSQTTVNPSKPELATSLVTTGIYRWTRNPMYMGMCFVLIAWGVFLSSLPAIALVFGFVLYMSRFQIAPEEAVLLKMFGEKFATYKNQVRRWL